MDCGGDGTRPKRAFVHSVWRAEQGQFVADGYLSRPARLALEANGAAYLHKHDMPAPWERVTGRWSGRAGVGPDGTLQHATYRYQIVSKIK